MQYSTQHEIIRPLLSYRLVKTALPMVLSMGLIIAGLWFQIPYLIYASLLPLFYATFRLIAISTVRYELKDGQLLYHRGVFMYRMDTIELYRVKDFSVTKPLWVRLFGGMHIDMQTSDKSHPYFQLKGVPNSNLADVIRDQVTEARQKNRVFEVD